MFVGLLFLSLGCTVGVGAEVLAYQEIVPAAWGYLPYSAILELAIGCRSRAVDHRHVTQPWEVQSIDG